MTRMPETILVNGLKTSCRSRVLSINPVDAEGFERHPLIPCSSHLGRAHGLRACSRARGAHVEGILAHVSLDLGPLELR